MACAVGVKFWVVTTAVLIAVSAVTLHSPYIAMNNAASVFVALAAAFDWHVRAHTNQNNPHAICPFLSRCLLMCEIEKRIHNTKSV